MAADDFQTTVGRLWARLGLPTPRFTEPGRVQLRIDGASVDLVDNGRGSLLIEGAIGSLATDPALRARQVRRVLETNLGLLLGNETGVYLKTLPNRDTVVAGRSSYRFADGQLDRLVKKIEDTIETIEYYAAELKLMGASAPRGKPSAAASAEPAIIFRP